MKFSSNPGLMFRLITVVISILIIGFSLYGIYEGSWTGIARWTMLASLPVVFILWWMYFDTHYELTDCELIYVNGPFRGRINLISIREISEGPAPTAGFRPATADNGLTIRYGNNREIYISPAATNKFLRKILELNREIRISSVSPATA